MAIHSPNNPLSNLKHTIASLNNSQLSAHTRLQGGMVYCNGSIRRLKCTEKYVVPVRILSRYIEYRLLGLFIHGHIVCFIIYRLELEVGSRRFSMAISGIKGDQNATNHAPPRQLLYAIQDSQLTGA